MAVHDRLIHVYHFTKDTAQNQMVLESFMNVDENLTNFNRVLLFKNELFHSVSINDVGRFHPNTCDSYFLVMIFSSTASTKFRGTFLLGHP